MNFYGFFAGQELSSRLISEDEENSLINLVIYDYILTKLRKFYTNFEKLMTSIIIESEVVSFNNVVDLLKGQSRTQ